jgi:hypothetical protein
MAEDNFNSKNTKSESKADGVSQPLMSTGTTEPSFDWVPNQTNTSSEPKIGTTEIGEKNNSDSK